MTRPLGMAASLACLGLLAASPAASKSQDPSGAWIIRADQGDASIANTLELKVSGAKVEGRSGPLDTFGLYPLQLRGERSEGGMHVVAFAKGETVGFLDLTLKEGALFGSGKLFGTPVTVVGARAVAVTPGTRVIDFDPTQFHVLTSNEPAPVLHLAPGDIVRTRTVDAYGRDEDGSLASMAGNPGTGPFYVEGAAPGDTLAVRILKLTPNRTTARMAGTLAPTSVEAGYLQGATAGRTDIWLLDQAQGIARIQAPSDRLKNFRVPLRPMLGVVGVAPPDGLSVPNSDLGEWGGNLDFSEIREGATLYLPVFQPGGMLFLGDAHARQGDGEVTGQGLETSMRVQFQVAVIKAETLGQPWSENPEYVMVSGIGGSLDDALHRATTGLAKWLKLRYQLDDNDIAAILGSCLEYQIAEVVDPKYHVVAKLKKATLRQIEPAPKPVAAH